MKAEYEVAVIGSGYGGGIAACRLARAGRKVVVLEKGKEFLPGDFPNTPSQALKEIQLNLGHHSDEKEDRNGLYDFSIHDDLVVFKGCGLGGTSLVNANVSIQPEPRIFQDPRFPKELQDISTLNADYEQARKMLKPTQVPDPSKYKKTQVLKKASKAFQEKYKLEKDPFKLADINVNFKSGLNEQGVLQNACVDCGDCVSGCNYSAKNTVAMNYLPDAKYHHAEIYCSIDVIKILPAVDEHGNPVLNAEGEHRWQIWYRKIGLGRNRFNQDPEMEHIIVDMVVVSGGTLGSTEIMLRSKKEGLVCSDQVGTCFSGNGDMIGFAYNGTDPVNNVGFGEKLPGQKEPVGPCITGIIDARDVWGKDADLVKDMIFEDGTPPGLVNTAYSDMLAIANLTNGVDDNPDDNVDQVLRALEHKATLHTLGVLVMANDDSSGTMDLNKHGQLAIHWPEYGKSALFKDIESKLRTIADSNSAKAVSNPLWKETSLGNRLVTVHPLGGCPMGDDGEKGVVNHRGQLFTGKGDEVYPNFLICDGSVIPRSVGVNPLLTISAVSERAIRLYVEKKGWNSENLYKKIPKPELMAYIQQQQQEQGQTHKPGIQFTEKMDGTIIPIEALNAESVSVIPNFFKVTAAARSVFEKAVNKHKATDTSAKFVMTIISDDVEAFLKDKNVNHTAPTSGFITVTTLDSRPFTMQNGTFQLFNNSTQSIDKNTKEMWYIADMILDDKKYHFRGCKVAHNDRGFDMWADITTLFVSIYDQLPDANGKPQGNIVCQGMMYVRIPNLIRQLTTMQIPNVPRKIDQLHYLGKFGLFFGLSLVDVYGMGLGGGHTVEKLPNEHPVRATRPLTYVDPKSRLRVPLNMSDVHVVMVPLSAESKEQIPIVVRRYHGGNRGAVLLVHGFGHGSRVFDLDTIQPNLVEELCSHGYDVYLVDTRQSTLLSAKTRERIGKSEVEDVGLIDLPAVINRVLIEHIAPLDIPEHPEGTPQDVIDDEAAKRAEGDAMRVKNCKVHVIAHCMGASAMMIGLLSGKIQTSQIASLALSQVATHFTVSHDENNDGFLKQFGKWWGKLDVQQTPTFLDTLMGHQSDACPAKDEGVKACNTISSLYKHQYNHTNLSADTHIMLHELYDTVSPATRKAWEALIAHPTLVDRHGNDVYLANGGVLKGLPILLLGGDTNHVFKPKSLDDCADWLKKVAQVEANVVQIKGYGHTDCFIGGTTDKHVFPHFVEHLANNTSSL